MLNLWFQNVTSLFQSYGGPLEGMVMVNGWFILFVLSNVSVIDDRDALLQWNPQLTTVLFTLYNKW